MIVRDMLADLSGWKQFVVLDEGTDDSVEAEFAKLDILAGLRARPRAVPASRRVWQHPSSDDNDEDNQATTVAARKSDAEDGECDDTPDGTDGCGDETLGEDRDLERMNWVDCKRLLTDQRARTSSILESMIPHWNLPNFRDESWLNWFLYYMLLTIIQRIIHAKNMEAIGIA